MTAISTATEIAGADDKPVFWEVLWRSAGLQAIGLFAIAAFLQGAQPGLGASPDELAAFYSANQTSILIAAALMGLATLNLVWFAAAIRAVLADVGRDGWGAAATASSAAFGAMLLIITAFRPALALTGTANEALLSGLNGLSWSMMVLIAFPRAMLIMSAAFGLWRAKIISDRLFALGVAFVVAGVAGGTTWISNSVWAPDGFFTRVVSPSLLLVWVVIVSWVLLTRRQGVRAGW